MHTRLDTQSHYTQTHGIKNNHNPDSQQKHTPTYMHVLYEDKHTYSKYTLAKQALIDFQK